MPTKKTVKGRGVSLCFICSLWNCLFYWLEGTFKLKWWFYNLNDFHFETFDLTFKSIFRKDAQRKLSMRMWVKISSKTTTFLIWMPIMPLGLIRSSWLKNKRMSQFIKSLLLKILKQPTILCNTHLKSAALLRWKKPYTLFTTTMLMATCCLFGILLVPRTKQREYSLKRLMSFGNKTNTWRIKRSLTKSC